MGMEVVAEGVETLSQLSQLPQTELSVTARVICSSRPVDAESVTAWNSRAGRTGNRSVSDPLMNNTSRKPAAVIQLASA